MHPESSVIDEHESPAIGTSREMPETDLIGTYLRAIGQTPLLTAEEEKELSNRIQQGDIEARNRLVEANLRLVVHMARSWTRHGVGLFDLIERGNMVLLRAARHFKADKNVRFSTYAAKSLNRTFQQMVETNGRTIDLPHHIPSLIAKYREAVELLRKRTSSEPDFNDVCTHLGFSRTKKMTLSRALNAKISVHPSQSAAQKETIEEMIAAEPAVGDCEREEERRRLHYFLSQLNGDQAAVIRMRYFFDDSNIQSEAGSESHKMTLGPTMAHQRTIMCPLCVITTRDSVATEPTPSVWAVIAVLPVSNRSANTLVSARNRFAKWPERASKTQKPPRRGYWSAAGSVQNLHLKN